MPTTTKDSATPEQVIVEDSTCTFCGCLCDDIKVTADRDRIIEAQNACNPGQRWFSTQHTSNPPSCLINGQPTILAEGIERATQILLDARYPLIFGLRDSTSEAQRIAVAIADWIGACVDPSSDVSDTAATTAFQEVGAVTCTLGEIKNRSDLIIIWGADPAESHPRFIERYCMSPPSDFLPGGRIDRTFVVIDHSRNQSAAFSDLFIPIKPGRDFEAFSALRAIAKGIELDPKLIEAETGSALKTWESLFERIRRSSYGVIFYGGGSGTPSGCHLDYHALFSLVRELNDFTRFVCMRIAEGSNPNGAENVVTWLTGYPSAVNLTRGYPRYGPREYDTNAILERGEADMALVVGGEPTSRLSTKALTHLARIPTIALMENPLSTPKSTEVVFHTSTYGINTPGTVYRMDGVPLPLRPALASALPSQEEILKAIEKRVRAR